MVADPRMNTPALSALIAEDEPLLAQALRDDLAALWPQLQVHAVVGDGESALQQALAQRPSVCFFDIRMPGLSGLEAAAALADEWPQDAAAAFPLIVFVTAYDQYALKAFDVQAADYLVKPVQRERLEACVARLRKKLADRAAAAADPSAVIDATVRRLRGLIEPAAASATRLDVIQAASGSTVRLVPVDEVLYFEAADKYVRVVTAHAEHLIRLSLRELLPQLDPQRFWQVHRGLVVQAREIDTAARDDTGRVMLTLRRRPGERLTASRMYAHRFRGM
jgi:DNA-binding LytR/AlgR family response regulator